MRKPLSLTIVVCCLVLLAGSLAWAGPRGRDLPHRYLSNSLDGRLVEVTNPVDGTAWAAWAYRNGAEYDLAVSFRDESGFWSEPMLIGVGDGLDQAQPALAADVWGNIYLAFTERAPDRIMLCWLEAGSAEWTSPAAVTGPGVRAMQPALRVVGERLVLAFRSGGGSVILDLPLFEPVMVGDGLQDTPDPVGAYDPVDPANPTDDPDDDPLLPLDDTSGGAWGSTTTD